MIFEELAFVFEGRHDGLGRFDIALTTVNHRYISQAQRNDTSSKDIHDIGSRVPDIGFNKTKNVA
jgi:hypothetical protein